jgi:hypothetical protein
MVPDSTRAAAGEAHDRHERLIQLVRQHRRHLTMVLTARRGQLETLAPSVRRGAVR